MKAINVGDNTYDIFDDSMQVYSQLPAQAYVVRCSMGRGFYLEKYNEMEVNESKIYGVHLSKINKVMNMFRSSERNLGVILSGDKGIGKSLFARLLSNEVIKNGMPVIIVDTYIQGIASYIESIQQEVMILFDEFDKTFGEVKSKDGEASPQTSLLSLFDGLSSGKKLFVITCNDLNKLNEYLINRPGRFHYHFRFDYPSAAEIREYLKDKLKEEYYTEIDSVISFSNKVSLNFDCLRAIATELNTGLVFSEAIKDLNIINTETQRYNLVLKFKNGYSVRAKNVGLDMFGDSGTTQIYMYNNKGINIIDIEFDPNDAYFDMIKTTNIVAAENLSVSYFFDEEDEDEKTLMDELKKCGVDYLMINRKGGENIHYRV